jgi:calcineurin-like phosphoesterase
VVELCGALVDIDTESGEARGIERVREKVEI